MTVQNITALSTFNPHAGSVTHTSQDQNLTVLYTPIFKVIPHDWLRMKITSHLTRDDLIWYQTRYLFSLLWTPFTLCSGIERLPTRSKHLMVLTYSALDIVLSFHSRVTFRHHPRCYQPDSRPFRGPFFRRYPLSFIRTMKTPKEGWRLHHDDLKQRTKGMNMMERPLREEQPRPRRSVRISQPQISPLHHLLNLGTRFLVVEENCDARIIKLQ